MPILQYKCPACGHEFEELVPNYTLQPPCPKCGQTANRVWCGQVFSATGKPAKKCSGNCKRCGGCK